MRERSRKLSLFLVCVFRTEEMRTANLKAAEWGLIKLDWRKKALRPNSKSISRDIHVHCNGTLFEIHGPKKNVLLNSEDDGPGFWSKNLIF